MNVTTRKLLVPWAGALGGHEQADCPRDGEEVKQITVVIPSRSFIRRQRREDIASWGA